MEIDIEYLRRIDAIDPSAIGRLLSEPAFLRAQQALFDVVQSMGAAVDFDIADMREVHIAAALAKSLNGLRVLDLACGSVSDYVLDDTFRDRYPPLLSELLSACGSDVTGIDIRDNPAARYTHLVRDLTDAAWPQDLENFDVIACISLFNAPQSVFEGDPASCINLLRQCNDVLTPDGALITTLPDQLNLEQSTPVERAAIASEYLRTCGFALLHVGKGMAWATKNQQ